MQFEKNSFPIAMQKQSLKEKHGIALKDNYRWLEDEENAKVIEQIENENDYADSFLADNDELISRLERRLVELTRHDDESYPYQIGDYFYYEKLSRGVEHERYYRAKSAAKDEECLIFDPNKLEQEHGYVDVAFVEPSPDGSLVAIGIDIKGDESYQISIRDIASGEVIDSAVSKSEGSFAWSLEGKAFYYARLDKRQRPDSIWRHQLGERQKQDQLILKENDERFFVSCEAARDERYITIQIESHRTSEAYLIDTSSENLSPCLISPRQEKVEYYINPSDDWLYNMTNAGGDFDFRIDRLPIKGGQISGPATTFIAHEAGCLIEGIDTFKDIIYVWKRQNGSRLLEAYDENGCLINSFLSNSPLTTLSGGDNHLNDSTSIRLSTSSPVEAEALIEWCPKTNTKTTLQSYPPPMNFVSSDYITQRIFAPAKDGSEIPVTLLAHKSIDFAAAPQMPLYIEAYGAYGDTYETDFSLSRITLADNGFICAIAHVRGGEEKGRQWYFDGCHLNKANTIKDLISVRNHLVDQEIAHANKVIISGGSAGGLAVGGALNKNPQAFAGAILDVPFVDVITTMGFTDHALTPLEYDEWGNPENETDYRYMLSYSPYENIKKAEYPPVYVTASLNDSRVPFWEAAKYISKLRELSSGEGPYILKVETESGHAGVSGRYSALREAAEELAFAVLTAGAAAK